MTLLNVSLDIVYIPVLSPLLHSLATQKLFRGTKCPTSNLTTTPTLPPPSPSLHINIQLFQHHLLKGNFSLWKVLCSYQVSRSPLVAQAGPFERAVSSLTSSSHAIFHSESSCRLRSDPCRLRTDPRMDRAAQHLTGPKKSSFIQPRWELPLPLVVVQLLRLGCLDHEERQVWLSEQCHEGQ